jgi:hypothetical protein
VVVAIASLGVNGIARADDATASPPPAAASAAPSSGDTASQLHALADHDRSLDQTDSHHGYVSAEANVGAGTTLSLSNCSSNCVNAFSVGGAVNGGYRFASGLWLGGLVGYTSGSITYEGATTTISVWWLGPEAGWDFPIAGPVSLRPSFGGGFITGSSSVTFGSTTDSASPSGFGVWPRLLVHADFGHFTAGFDTTLLYGSASAQGQQTNATGLTFNAVAGGHF